MIHSATITVSYNGETKEVELIVLGNESEARKIALDLCHYAAKIQDGFIGKEELSIN